VGPICHIRRRPSHSPQTLISAAAPAQSASAPLASGDPPRTRAPVHTPPALRRVHALAAGLRAISTALNRAPPPPLPRARVWAAVFKIRPCAAVPTRRRPSRGAQEAFPPPQQLLVVQSLDVVRTAPFSSLLCAAKAHEHCFLGFLLMFLSIELQFLKSSTL
jgi:hypothetical protein